MLHMVTNVVVDDAADVFVSFPQQQQSKCSLRRYKIQDAKVTQIQIHIRTTEATETFHCRNVCVCVTGQEEEEQLQVELLEKQPSMHANSRYRYSIPLMYTHVCICMVCIQIHTHTSRSSNTFSFNLLDNSHIPVTVTVRVTVTVVVTVTFNRLAFRPSSSVPSPPSTSLPKIQQYTQRVTLLYICHAHNEVEQKCFWGCSPSLTLTLSPCLYLPPSPLFTSLQFQFQSHNRVSNPTTTSIKSPSHSRVIRPTTRTTTTVTVN